MDERFQTEGDVNYGPAIQELMKILLPKIAPMLVPSELERMSSAPPQQRRVMAGQEAMGLTMPLNISKIPGNVGKINVHQEEIGNWFTKTLKRVFQENEGQAILDDLMETGVSPQSISKDFWENTYYRLPAEVQQRFQKYLSSLGGGIKPGDVLFIKKGGERVMAKDWMDIAANSDLPLKVEHLEGTERGYIALMDEANRRFKDITNKTGKNIVGGKGLDLETGEWIPLP